MQNTITLNGQSSADIPGLLIQELPPISKPRIRTEIEEIDGRDGDIVTPLGYSAYDKEISIGLYGDFDIDEIIDFFNSEGTVTFSNEADKYYNYQIFDQIDFERLVRFRTAKVKMHVQPFKYSTEEQSKVFELGHQAINVQNYSKTINDVTLTVSENVVSISGTPSAATEFYVPLENLVLPAGAYTLSGTAHGTNEQYVSFRLIGSVPSDADSFGGQYLTFSNEGTVSLQAALGASKSYGYLWFYLTSGRALDFSATFSMQDSNPDNTITIRNSGNYIAKPQITLTGTGTVNLSLNGNQIFVINFGATSQSITIDTASMEAYQDTPDTSMNRNVDGDYDNFSLAVGSNSISWSGTLTQIVINNYSRWI